MAEISSSDRVAFVGKTGSGKTFAANLLLAGLPRLVVFDSKGTLANGWGLEPWNWSTARKLAQGKPVRIRVPAPLDNDWEPFFQACYDAGDVTVYIDEMYGVLSSGGRPGRYLTALYTRGRELGIGTWACTQRPAWVPLFMLSESDWILLFRLQLEEDRKRMSQIIGPQAHATLRGHELYLFHQEWETARFYKQISKGKT